MSKEINPKEKKIKLHDGKLKNMPVTPS